MSRTNSADFHKVYYIVSSVLKVVGGISFRYVPVCAPHETQVELQKCLTQSSLVCNLQMDLSRIPVRLSIGY